VVARLDEDLFGFLRQAEELVVQPSGPAVPAAVPPVLVLPHLLLVLGGEGVAGLLLLPGELLVDLSVQAGEDVLDVLFRRVEHPL
jgi:hypothetical protein